MTSIDFSNSDLNYSTFVFDFDGTLVQSDEIKKEVFIRVADKYGGGEIIKNLLEGDFKGTRVDYFEETLKNLGVIRSGDRVVSEMVASFTEICEEEISNCSEIEGASDLLEHLKAEKINICINSATPTSTLVKIVNNRGWNYYFDSIRGAETSKMENLEQIRKNKSAEKKDIVFIGNGQDDYQSALQYGVSFIAIGNAEFVDAPLFLRQYPNLAKLLIDLS